MSGRDIALTGVPRGGTTLACRLLGDCEDTVSLFEPMDVMALPAGDEAAAIDAVEAFYRACRERLAGDGRLPSKQRDGRVPDNPFGDRDADGRRALVAEAGWIHVEPRPGADCTLVVKHNAAFAALLPGLARRVETVAVVRNPAAVLASWHSVALPVTDGRIPAGERLDAGLRHRLDALGEVVDRQLLLLEWFFARFAEHLPARQVVRYEDIVATGGSALIGMLGLVAARPATLASRNANPLYDAPRLRHALRALCNASGSWERWYPPSRVREAADKITAGPR